MALLISKHFLQPLAFDIHAPHISCPLLLLLHRVKLAKSVKEIGGELHAGPERERREVRLWTVDCSCPSEPVAVEKHGRTVVVMLAVEEYNRLNAVVAGAAPNAPGGAQGEE